MHRLASSPVAIRLGRCLMAVVIAVATATTGIVAEAVAQQTEQRFGLVIGNGEYKSGPLPTAANDAGLIAQTLQAAGFDVMGARDLDGDALRQTFRDFVDKVTAAGPDAVAFVYLAGHALQFEGENYFVPVDARIERDLDVPLQALRLSDYIRPLGALQPKMVAIALDAARENPFARTGKRLAGGLAMMEPGTGMLIAFNAAPGTIGPPGQGPYGAYAEALAEMIRDGGLPVDRVFDRVRLRVHEKTAGAEVPWHASQVTAPFVFFERGADAPQEASFVTSSARRERPIRAFDDAREAYLAALERDTMQGYLDFLAVYPNHGLSNRVRAIVAARREAITWRRARNADTPEAYWSYLDRYPDGPHANDASRRLSYLTAPLLPPPTYMRFDYDLPPPPPEEIYYVRRHAVYFADPVYGFIAPPLIPIFFLPPPPRYFRPPPPPIAIFVLPVPVFVPVAAYVRPPVYVQAPPNNPIFQQVRAGPGAPPPGAAPPGAPPPGGAAPPVAAPGAAPPGAARGGGPGIGTAVGVGAAAAVAVGAAAAVALPPSVAKRSAAMPAALAPGASAPPSASPPAGGAGTLRVPQPGGAPASPLPGTTKGAPLPPAPGVGGRGLPPGAPGAGNAPPPKAATVTPPGTPPGTPPSTSAGQPPGQAGPSLQRGSQPKSGQPPVGQPPAPAAGAGLPPLQQRPGQAALPDAKTTGRPPAAVTPPARQERIDRAQQDRSQVEQRVQQDRQRDLERRKQEAGDQSRARQSQQQQQDLQKQRQQQQDQQRKAMDQQRQQQVQQQQQQRQQQQAAQAAQAAQRQQQQAAQAAQAAQRQQQQAAQAAAQAKAAQQAQQKKCGVPGLPPCPR